MQKSAPGKDCTGSQESKAKAEELKSNFKKHVRSPKRIKDNKYEDTSNTNSMDEESCPNRPKKLTNENRKCLLVETVRAILELQPKTWVFLGKIFTRHSDFLVSGKCANSSIFGGLFTFSYSANKISCDGQT
jgi:hypothetical protein